MLKRILIGAAAVLAALAAAEGALRLAWDAAAARAEVERVRGAALASIPGLEVAGPARGRIPHPFLGWDDRNRLDQHVNELLAYRRGAYDDAFEVLVLGGSVSGLLGNLGVEAMAEVLHADPRFAGREIVALNHGRGSFKQPQQVMLTAYLLALGYRPDLILNVDGFNEVALGFENASLRAHPLYPHWPSFTMMTAARERSPEVIEAAAALRAAQRELDRAAREALEGRALASGILGRLVLHRVQELGLRCGELQDEVLRLLNEAQGDDPTLGPTLILPDPALAGRGPAATALESIVAGWVEGSVQLDALARAHGIPYVHVLQPTLHDPGSKPMTDLERERGKLKDTWRRGVLEGYPRLREAGRELQARGVAFFDLSGVFHDFDEQAYYDACHFRGESMKLFAREVGRRILEVLP